MQTLYKNPGRLRDNELPPKKGNVMSSDVRHGQKLLVKYPGNLFFRQIKLHRFYGAVCKMLFHKNVYPGEKKILFPRTGSCGWI
jgi:hypothetical protein